MWGHPYQSAIPLVDSIALECLQGYNSDHLIANLLVPSIIVADLDFSQLGSVVLECFNKNSIFD